MKNILLASLVGVIGIGFILKDKAKNIIDDYNAAMRKLRFRIDDIANVKYGGGALKASIKLNVNNPTTTNLVAETGGLVTLSKLDFYTNSGDFIGTARPNITAFDFPANSTTTTQFIPVEMPIGISLFSTVMNLLKDPKKIIVKPTIVVLDKTHTF